MQMWVDHDREVVGVELSEVEQALRQAYNEGFADVSKRCPRQDAWRTSETKRKVDDLRKQLDALWSPSKEEVNDVN